MIEKVNLRQMLTIVGIGLAINFLFFGYGKSTTIRELQADTDRNLGTIKVNTSAVGVGINRSEAHNTNAIQAIERTRSEITGSREAVSNLDAGIEKLEFILAECERLAGESKAIIERVDGAN